MENPQHSKHPSCSHWGQDLKVLKTTQSGFEGFLRDRFTTLQEAKDRSSFLWITLREHHGTVRRKQQAKLAGPSFIDSPVRTSLRVIRSSDLPSISCQEERETLTDILDFSAEEHADLILKSCGLLLKPCCFEVIDDIGDPPVGRVRHLTILYWAVAKSLCQVYLKQVSQQVLQVGAKLLCFPS
ncbi:hypothetical protein INR49_012225 [Caranx melampygus]|nr:hypothetical protein INR49_012225 [Caranx melampygus]